MARWRLTESHYLNCPNTNWRRTEISNDGEAVEHNYNVPRLLDINDPRCHTDKANQLVIVCYEGKGQPGDRVFVGDPTPGMQPLDEEARAISAEFEGRWQHPIESLPNGLGPELIRDLERQIQAIGATQKPSGMIPNQAVSKDEFETLKNQMAELMAQNQKLVEQLTAQPAPETKASAGRRA